MIDTAKQFAVAFWRTMGNRENHLAAYRDAGLILLVLIYLSGVAAIAQGMQP
jgi:hypothetical protein